MINRLFQLKAALDLSPLPQTAADTNKPIETALYIAFVILGGISLIVIMIAGIKFMTSQGDPGQLSKARQAIIYAAIGLGVAISASSILNFVLTQVSR